MSRRCECPEYSHETERDGMKSCECPKDSSWDDAAKKCQCTDPAKRLSHKGCVEDKRAECKALPLAYYEKHSNECVEFLRCEDAGMPNCKKCVKRFYYDEEDNDMNGVVKCEECRSGWRHMHD